MYVLCNLEHLIAFMATHRIACVYLFFFKLTVQVLVLLHNDYTQILRVTTGGQHALNNQGE
jgi:hypothetical protein